MVINFILWVSLIIPQAISGYHVSEINQNLLDTHFRANIFVCSLEWPLLFDLGVTQDKKSDDMGTICCLMITLAYHHFDDVLLWVAWTSATTLWQFDIFSSIPSLILSFCLLIKLICLAYILILLRMTCAEHFISAIQNFNLKEWQMVTNGNEILASQAISNTIC